MKDHNNLERNDAGDKFASGTINLGELQVAQISTFNKVWASYEGGLEDLEATIFEPTGLPEGFYMLVYYSQPSNKPFFGLVLVAKDNSSFSNPAVTKPLDYTLIWSTKSLKFNQNSSANFWQPASPDGYKAIGHVVTTTHEIYNWIWEPGNRGTQAPGLLVTLRVSNFDGELKSVYLSEHSGGIWVDPFDLEFKEDGNKPVVYSSLHGHAINPKQGTSLQGANGVGIRNDTAASNTVVDIAIGYEVVSAECLGSEMEEPPWLNYFREWGPKISYDAAPSLYKILPPVEVQIQPIKEIIIIN
ncbi:hypothetical protein K1719_039905 [Acacia pycnantha]|nr:hypothetical protein K1719_039905 [Acacia pycnantha]